MLINLTGICTSKSGLDLAQSDFDFFAGGGFLIPEGGAWTERMSTWLNLRKAKRI